MVQIFAPHNSSWIPDRLSIEVATSLQIPSFQIVGLPAPEVAEARERIKASIETSGLEFPRKRVVLNLSPASVRKRGTGLDLPMALGILAQTSPMPASSPPDLNLLAWAELSLDGSIKSTGQILRPIYCAWRFGIEQVLLPESDKTAAIRALKKLAPVFEKTGGFCPRLIFAHHLAQAWFKISHLTQESPTAVEPNVANDEIEPNSSDFDQSFNTNAHVVSSLGRILGVAAAGDHHLILLGPRGAGKSMAVDWLSQVRPPLSAEDVCMRDLANELGQRSRTQDERRVSRPSSAASLRGHWRGADLRSGEFSSAHGGLLIADEFPEWSRDCREALREPLETGSVRLHSVEGSAELPARFTLAATGNLCECGGYDGTGTSNCRCSIRSRELYLSRLSGPVLDRIDLRVCLKKSEGQTSTVSSGEVRQKVQEVRDRSLDRFKTASGRIPAPVLENYLNQNPQISHHPAIEGALSWRSRHKTLRVALTLAFWDSLETPTAGHLREAALLRWSP